MAVPLAKAAAACRYNDPAQAAAVGKSVGPARTGAGSVTAEKRGGSGPVRHRTLAAQEWGRSGREPGRIKRGVDPAGGGDGLRHRARARRSHGADQGKGGGRKVARHRRKFLKKRLLDANGHASTAVPTWPMRNIPALAGTHRA